MVLDVPDRSVEPPVMSAPEAVRVAVWVTVRVAVRRALLGAEAALLDAPPAPEPDPQPAAAIAVAVAVRQRRADGPRRRIAVAA